MEGGREEARRRFDITLENAAAFLSATHQMSVPFQPLGVIQGWSPNSMAEAARRLVAMGYDYLRSAGPFHSNHRRSRLVSSRSETRSQPQPGSMSSASPRLTRSILSPLQHHSFDTTSPLLRAFKDAKANYYLPNQKGGISYYTAIRVPQAIENTKLVRLAKRGDLDQERYSVSSARRWRR